MKTVVLGVGMTPFRKMPDRSLASVGGEAVIAALRDAGVSRTDVGAAYCGNVLYGGAAGQAVLAGLGMTGLPVTNVENACASGGTAFAEAVNAIESGRVEVALAFGVEMLTHTGAGLIPASRPDVAAQLGLPLPGLYALKAQRYMSRYGATREQLAAVVVKNRHNAVTNEYAYFRSAVTEVEVLASPSISEPLTLFQCCPNVDGAAAAVLTSADYARRHRSGARSAITVAGYGMASGHRNDEQNSLPDITERAAAAAYQEAAVGPSDVDVCEVHEPFSIAELLHYESLGFCAVGEGGEYVAAGRAAIDGDGVAVNTSGGLLSRGHPLGASGIAQIVEIVTQLRGDAGARQRDGARVGLSHIVGGTIPELDGNACVVGIFIR
jgi:acetyl-CoA acetyltransferase